MHAQSSSGCQASDCNGLACYADVLIRPYCHTVVEGVWLEFACAALLQAQRRPATTCTGVFDDIDAPAMQEKDGGRWPKGCTARALQTPFTDRWGDAELSVCDPSHPHQYL